MLAYEFVAVLNSGVSWCCEGCRESIDSLQTAVNPLRDSFRNPHRGVAAFDPGALTRKLDHSRFLAEKAPDGVFAEEPELCQFRHGVMPFKCGHTKRGLLANSYRNAFHLWLEFHVAPRMLCRFCKKCGQARPEHESPRSAFNARSHL